MCVCVCLVALIESGPWEAGCLSCGVVISSHCVTGWVRWQSLTVKSISQINIAKDCSPGSMNNECSHFGSKLACCLARRAWAHLCVSTRLPLAPSVSLSICGGVLSQTSHYKLNCCRGIRKIHNFSVSVCEIYCSISAESDLGWVQECGPLRGYRQEQRVIKISSVLVYVHDAIGSRYM